jgi:hypothetical protein
VPEIDCGFDDVAGGAKGSDILVDQGPTILVDIGFDPAYVATAAVKPVSGIQDVRALVDSGAYESCIDSLLATQLGLPVIDRKPIAGALGAGEVNIHLAQIHVPSLGVTVYGKFAGVHLAAGGQAHQALIGRTFLKHFTMVYEGRTGKVKITSA